MVKRTSKGDVYDINSYRIWLVNFDQSTQGKFLVFGSKEDAVAAAKSIAKSPEMKHYPYRPKIKEITGRMR